MLVTLVVQSALYEDSKVDFRSLWVTCARPDVAPAPEGFIQRRKDSTTPQQVENQEIIIGCRANSFSREAYFLKACLLLL